MIIDSKIVFGVNNHKGENPRFGMQCSGGGDKDCMQ